MIKCSLLLISEIFLNLRLIFFRLHDYMPFTIHLFILLGGLLVANYNPIYSRTLRWITQETCYDLRSSRAKGWRENYCNCILISYLITTVFHSNPRMLEATKHFIEFSSLCLLCPPIYLPQFPRPWWSWHGIVVKTVHCLFPHLCCLLHMFTCFTENV